VAFGCAGEAEFMTASRHPAPWLLRVTLRLLCARERREALEGDLVELLQTRRRRSRVVRDLVSVIAMLLMVRLRSLRPTGLAHDWSLAGRAIVRRPAFAAAVIATMALGIGANTAIFSLVNAVLLRTMPVHDPKALVLLGVSSDGSGLGSSFPYLFYRQLHESGSGALAGAICQARTSPNVDADGRIERVFGELVSLNYFDVLGVRPHIGRLFSEADARVPGGDRVVVLSHGYWQRRFGGDANVVGRSIRVNMHSMTIIGVAAPSFHGLELGGTVDLRVPVTMQPQMDGSASRLENAEQWFLQIVGRLAPGVSRAQAESLLRAEYARFIAERLARPPQNQLAVLDGSRGRPTLQHRFRAPLAILSALGALVLALVCLNVANLMLSRAAGRRKEVAVTLALGAGLGRIVQQLLLEAVMLASIGGGVGLALSLWGARILASMALPAPSGPLLDIPLDARVMSVAAFTALATAVLCALAPAVWASRLRPSAALGTEGRHVISARMLGRRLLVSAQIALSLAILVGAGLFMRTLINLQRLDVGFNTRRVALLSLNPALGGYEDARVRMYYRSVMAAMTAMPGVESAALSVMPLLDVSRWGSGLTLDTGEQDNQPGPLRDAVSAGYFRSVGIPIVEGRDFSGDDRAGAPAVTIVNEAFARRYFGGGSALGRRIGAGGSRGPAGFTIVGVARDSRVTHVREPPAPFWYVPYEQLNAVGQLTLHVRTTGDAAAALDGLTQAVGAIDKGVGAFRARTMTQQIDGQIVAERLLAALGTAFGLIAALLASIGLYGVLSVATAGRTREVGVRMALGASPRSIFKMVVRQTCPLIIAGFGAGFTLAVALARQTGSLLFGIDAIDPVTLLSATALLAAVTAIATFIPARRATRVDPVSVLR
jgi:predicted permease